MTEKEPLEAQSVEVWTLDQLFERSLQEMRKSLGVPQVVEADKTDHVANASKLVRDHFTDTSKAIKDAKITGETTE